MLKGYVFICWNNEGVHGKKKVGNPWSKPKEYKEWWVTTPKYLKHNVAFEAKCIFHQLTDTD